MTPSSQQLIDAILQSLKKKGMAAAPVQEAMTLAQSEPAAIADLASAVMRAFPPGGTFLDGALSFLPEESWPSLIAQALDVIEASKQPNDAAESIITYASLQLPHVLHPHLDRIFRLRPSASAYNARYPWRGSGDRHFAFLRSIVENSAASAEDRQSAWEAMLQTRSPQALEYAATCAARQEFLPVGHDLQQWTVSGLASVGYELQDNRLHRLCPDACYHLVFPADYFDDSTRPAWRARLHPTWLLPATGTVIPSGGSSTNTCALCGGTLHRLLALEVVPAGLGVSELTRLELATCLACLGWQQQPLFYQHDAAGCPSQIGYDGPTIVPEFPSEPLKTAQLHIAVTPARWFWQDWGLSNSRENLHRLGGEPCWVQNAEYPRCPICSQTMHFLMQLDSDLPTESGGELLWGSGGIGYGFWCDGCKVSALHWQCT